MITNNENDNAHNSEIKKNNGYSNPCNKCNNNKKLMNE